MKSTNKNKVAYFVAPLSKKKELKVIYQKIVSILEDFGYKVYDDVNRISYKKAQEMTPEEMKAYFKKVEKIIRNADIFVAELTYPSPSIGFEIGYASANSIPVLVLQRDTIKESLGAPFKAHKSEIIQRKYNLENLRRKIEHFVKRAEKKMLLKTVSLKLTKKHYEFIKNYQKENEIPSFTMALRKILDEITSNKE